MHNTGARRITPLVRFLEDGRFFVFASKGGADEHPAWYHNLVANPDITVESGTESFHCDEGNERVRGGVSTVTVRCQDGGRLLLSVPTSGDGRTNTQESTMQSFDTPAPISAVLDIPAGRVRFVATDRADTTVEVLPADAAKGRDVKVAEQTKVEYGDGVLRIEASAKNQLLGASGYIEVTVQLPTGSSVEAKAASAEFRAVGRFGDVIFEGAHGSVDLDEAASVRITTQAGDVSVGRLDGPAEISTAKGDIRIAEAVRGTVVLRTEAGQVSVDAAAGVSAALDAGTSHGRIHNALKNTGGTADLNIHATTAYGDITARSL